ncbi:MAG: MBL fold metallo-hydrolase [Acidimicrobiales bacterium]|nr:MBL fold metallo-hydrolase [Acidimicrobiales bacterium]
MSLVRAADSRPIGLEPTELVEIVSVCDNVTDVLLPDEGPARRFRGGGGSDPLPAPLLSTGTAADSPLAQHGYSSLVRVQGASQRWSILFDTGATPDGCIDNLRRLGIDPDEIDAVVLSHGHYDHVTGLSGLAPVLGPRQVPVVVHPAAFRARRFPLPGGGYRELAHLDRAALEAAGFVVEAHEGPVLLADDRLLVTGTVDRHTEFEPGLPGQEALVDDHWQPDAEMPDDQALVMDLIDRGLVVMTGCGHSGIINIARHGRAVTGRDDVHAVMGGFHLGGRLFEPAIGPTVDGLVELEPDVVVPTHCTGWRAIAAIADALPESFVHNSVGTTYHLGPS